MSISAPLYTKVYMGMPWAANIAVCAGIKKYLFVMKNTLIFAS